MTISTKNSRETQCPNLLLKKLTKSFKNPSDFIFKTFTILLDDNVKGYLIDQRPKANSDPYKVIENIVRLFSNEDLN